MLAEGKLCVARAGPCGDCRAGNIAGSHPRASPGKDSWKGILTLRVGGKQVPVRGGRRMLRVGMRESPRGGRAEFYPLGWGQPRQPPGDMPPRLLLLLLLSQTGAAGRGTPVLNGDFCL